MVQKRDITMDILTMVAANMAAEVLAEPHPFWFRLYGTFAAPLFILISGLMVAYTAETKNYNLRHFLDGYFPLFPWTGFSLLGVNLARLRWKSRQHSTFGRNTIFLFGSSTLIIGSIIWRFYPGSFLIREGYSELFYPPTIGYVMSSIGLILILFFIVDLKPAIVIYKPLQVLGESSLFLYVLHLTLIEYVIAPLWPEKNIQTFLLIYVVLSCFLIVVAYGVRALKDRWKDRPFIIRFLFGN